MRHSDEYISNALLYSALAQLTLKLRNREYHRHAFEVLPATPRDITSRSFLRPLRKECLRRRKGLDNSSSADFFLTYLCGRKYFICFSKKSLGRSFFAITPRARSQWLPVFISQCMEVRRFGTVAQRPHRGQAMKRTRFYDPTNRH